ncbi:asparagine synthase (glutamine-hydrolyzing) [Agaribacter flavus]|uniref:asparagine synthase (glutamine-hydrolyzing) n=1 Tax=Agaribacter flavus TaxID=1902781 RepID=A0ABV7FPH3_9ALTE
MCGIAGFLTNNYANLTEQHLKQMGEAIAHRGPDASGEHLDEQVGLCHRRLSILDLSPLGRQPMYSEDNNVVIVFNGEIYNFLELRAELEQQGCHFKSSSDTEVIIKLYERDGIDCLPLLNGMFAFALWDKQQEQLFIARDRLGKKPLYYYMSDDTYTSEGSDASVSKAENASFAYNFNSNSKFAFASEIKALLTLPDIKKEVRTDAVSDFFAYQYIPDPKSIFKHIHKLPPAHYMLVKGGTLTIEKYWQLSFANQSSDNEQESVEKVKSLIADATKRRMISDVPLGAFLSGGVDSSGVVATMSALSEKPIKTCTIAFDNEKYNEAEFAKLVSEQYKTEHHEFAVNQNVEDSIEHVVSFFDEPFGDPSLVPTFFVSELARKEVTVAIAGDGGDEVFAGYEKYTTDYIENRIREKFPSWIRRYIFPSLASFCGLINIRTFKRAKSLLRSLSVEPDMGFYISNSFITDEQWQDIIKPQIRQELGDYHPSIYTLQHYASADGNDHLSKILYTDMKTYMSAGILVKVDRMSMANSLEVRAPIMDKEVIEFAATMPSSMKLRGTEKKYALKEAFKSMLSEDILYRKKMGFSVPLAQWFRVELKSIASKYLLEQAEGIPHYFDKDKVSKLWHEHQSGSEDHSAVLWSMLMFEMWWHRYMRNA